MSKKTQKTKVILGVVAFVALVATPLARADYSNTVYSQGPAGYWRLNETLQPVAGSSTAVNSGSLGTGANGTYNNFPSRGLAGPFAGSSAVSVDGLSQTVTSPYQAALNPTNFTIELWVNPASASVPGGLRTVASSMFSASPRSGWLIYQSDGSTGGSPGYQLRMYATNGLSVSLNLVAAQTVVPGTWTHLVFTFDGTTASAYLNGVLVNSGVPTGAKFVPNPSAAFAVGARSDNGFLWTGQAAEVAYYSNALSGVQITNHYSVATTTPASYGATVTADGPILFYRFQEAIDPPAANSSAAGSALNGLYIYDAKAGVPGPAPATYPGFEAANKAAAFAAGGGVVRIPPLNLNTNTVTISCWVAATNSQGIGAGIVVHGSGGNACGLTTDQVFSGYGLGYIWNGNNYGISPSSDFGLPALPDSQWAYAALVIRPEQAEIYICDANNSANWASMTNTYTVSHAPQQFASATLVGHAAGYTAPSHSFNGAVDEVTVFSRALSAGELYTQYGAAINGVQPRIFADIQGPASPPYEGDTLVLTVDAGGTPNLGYNWSKNSSYLTTTTTGTLSIPNTTTADSGTYEVTVTNASGSASSAALSITINPGAAPVITMLRGFVDRTLYPTGELNMAVSGTGGGLQYQWYKGGAAISGATASALRIINLTTGNAGAYSVNITNTHGSASNNGVTTITIPATVGGSYVAAVLGSNPESWWRLDESSGTNMFDGLGRHDGVYTNALGGATLPTLGVAGAILGSGNTAAQFSSTGKGIGLVPYSPALNPQAFTIEAWVKQNTIVNVQSPVSSSYENNGWWMQTSNGKWRGDTSGGLFGDYDPANPAGPLDPIFAGYWSHVVITYNGSSGFPYDLYINGATDGYIFGGVPLNTGGPLIIGARGVDASTLADRFFDGYVDEVAVYRRLLSGTEITNHFVARGIVVIPPTFSPALLAQTVTAGKTVTFSTTASGTAPQLQWYKGSTKLAGKTTASLTLTGVSSADAGTYTLWGTNSAGTNSISGTLSVILPALYANVTNDLVLHLRLDGDATDSSGRGNNAAEQNAPAYVTGVVGSQALEIATTVASGSVTSAKYANIGTVGSGPPADLQFGSSTSFTIGLWAKLNGTPGDLPFIGTETNAANNPGWFVGPGYGTGGWQWNLNDGAGNNIGLSGTGNTMNDGGWHHFLITVDRGASETKAYLDGVLASSTSIAGLGSINNNNYWPITIGQDPTGNYPEAGTNHLDDIGIWRRVLTATEVAQVESAGRYGGRSFDTVTPAPGAPVTITITTSGSDVVLSYSTGLLMRSTSLDPSAGWVPVPGASPPSYTIPPTGSYYYRVLVQ